VQTLWLQTQPYEAKQPSLGTGAMAVGAAATTMDVSLEDNLILQPLFPKEEMKNHGFETYNDVRAT